MFPNRELYENHWGWIPTAETPALLFDIETNGLLEDTTKVHCICAMDYKTGEQWRFNVNENNFDAFFHLALDYPVLIAHNGLCFDIPALRKLYPNYMEDLDEKGVRCFDTLVATRLIWTDVANDDFARIRSKKLPVEFPKKLIGRHSLKAWGYRLGEYKDDYAEVTENAWDHWSQEMEDYCMQDVVVLGKLYDHILKQNYSPEALSLEHEFQEVIFRQEQAGVLFDVKKATELYAQLASRRDILKTELQEIFPPKNEVEIFVPKRDNKVRGYKAGVPIERVHTIPFNPASREQIGERLTGLGWIPSEFTETGQPMVDETVLESLFNKYPVTKKLAEFLSLSKIIGMLAEGNNAWLKLYDKGHKIHGRVVTNGAVTGRCTHNSPNLAQIPARGEYGRISRSLFVAPDGMQMVGCDASGLELRMLASYMARYDRGNYAHEILTGDIHTRNQIAAGLPTRNDAKTFIYAKLYGAGDEKLGSIVAPDASPSVQKRKGKELQRKFDKAIPALKRLTEDVQAAASKRKYLFGIDGRRLNIRSQHSALNTLLQSAGAVMMKYATVILHKLAKEEGYILGADYVEVLHVHDEFQLNCKPEASKVLGCLAVQAIELAGKHFGFPCPTTGEYKIGKNWAETH